MPNVERHGSITVLRPNGPLREETLQDVDEAVQPQVSSGTPNVVIDLSDTPLIDGAGLEWILDLDEQCCRRGGSICICGVGELCADLLRITGVGASVQRFPDLTTALGSFA